jgi:hypothetical protein
MAKARLQLASQAVFRRTFVAAFVLVESAQVARIVRRVPPRWRVVRFMASIPYSLLVGLLVAALVTAVAAAVVRLVVRPLLERWLSPPADADMGQFHLAANERVVASSPARRSVGRGWPAGTLIRTNLRLWFLPHAHDGEIWSCPLDRLADVRAEPAAVSPVLIRDWPNRIAVRDDVGDEPALFAVSDPDAVLSWSRPAPAAAAGPSRS